MKAAAVSIVAILLIAAAVGLYWVGSGGLAEGPDAGAIEARAIAPAVVASRTQQQRAAAVAAGIAAPKQILFGDLHVHSTFSSDAFQMSLPMAGGDGAHPVADACDYARHCSALDFWSINDHAIALTPKRWAETVESVRQCNAVAADPRNPDTVAYLGWEWPQVGWVPEDHYGHKNVIFRDLEDGAIPTRPITAGLPPGTPPLAETQPSPFLIGAMALAERDRGGPELAAYLSELLANTECPSGVPVRELPDDCQEHAPTPEILFEKLDDWGLESMVIPHGTTWGFYTPLGSSWDKQTKPGMHDPERQRLIEVMSGHGNSEEFRPFREVLVAEDGSHSCPAPNANYLPSCWRAGEIISERCLAAGETAEECEGRAAEARQNYVDAFRNGGANVVPGATVEDWQDSGQCRDCFQPAFNYRPRSSVQYILALGGRDAAVSGGHFQFGMMAASDNHSARPGTGYKEVARSEFTEARFGNFVNTPLGQKKRRDPAPRSEPASRDFKDPLFSVFETERGASFFLNGGLTAVHSDGRSREAIWEALERREVYGTSGPRILLWFDLLNAPSGRPVPMGSAVALDEPPIFQVRAVGSFEQKPGCPADALDALAPDRLERLCQGECYHPSDRRRPITRIEVVRITPQLRPDESIGKLIEDPWRVIPCADGPGGCQVAFTDPDFPKIGRDALYYVRAIEAPSPAVAADPFGCERDPSGRCVEMHPCNGRPTDDDCLAETEERAWSSPIFVAPERI